MGYYKKLKLSNLLDSEDFPYAVAVLQSRTRNMDGNSFTITSKDPKIVQRTRKVLTSVLGLKVYNSSLKNNGYKQYRMKLDSIELMDFLRIMTLKNKRVPYFVRDSSLQRKNYIRGFLDSRAWITFYRSNTKKRLVHPRIGITTNYQLVKSFAYVLKQEDLAPSTNNSFLYLHGHDNAHKVIESSLLTESSKLEKLASLL